MRAFQQSARFALDCALKAPTCVGRRKIAVSSPQLRLIAPACSRRFGIFGSSFDSSNGNSSNSSSRANRDLGAAVLDVAAGNARPSPDVRQHGNEEIGFNPPFLSVSGESFSGPALVKEIEDEMLSESPDTVRVGRLLVHGKDMFALVRVPESSDEGNPQAFELLMAQDASETDPVLHLFSTLEAAQNHLDMQESDMTGVQVAKIDGISIFARRLLPTDEPTSSFQRVKLDNNMNVSNNDGYLEKLGAAVLLERVAFELSKNDNMNKLLQGKGMNEANAKMLRTMRRFQPYFVVTQQTNVAGEDATWSLCSTEDQHRHHYVFAFSFMDQAANFIKNLVDHEHDAVRIHVLSGASLIATAKGLEADGFIFNPGNPDRTQKFRLNLFDEAEDYFGDSKK